MRTAVLTFPGQPGQRTKWPKNLRTIREYIGKHVPGEVSIWENRDGSGLLAIYFYKLDSDKELAALYEGTFASFTVLCQTLRQWRNLSGTPLEIDGYSSGCVSYHNPKLVYRTS